MEEIKSIVPPRITFKRTSVKKKVGWEISSSSSNDKEELFKIVEMLKDINSSMENTFTEVKE